MISRVLIVLIASGSNVAWAGSENVAYVDAVASYGGVSADQSRTFVRTVVERAGYAPAFSSASRSCGLVHRCLRSRAHEVSATVALVATIVATAGQLSVSLYVVDVETGIARRVQANAVDLARPDTGLSAALAPDRKAAGPSRRRTIAAFTLAGAAAVLAIGGSLAWFEGRALRTEFFDDHIDSSGNVFGISPADARERERRVRNWQLAGVLLWTAALGSGAVSTLLFVSSREHPAPRPSGIAVRGQF